MSEESIEHKGTEETEGEKRMGAVPRCVLSEAGLECIGDGHGGCGWRGCEMTSESHACRYTLEKGRGITGYVLDPDGEETVWICPKCGGECAHTPSAEWIDDPAAPTCECEQNA